MKNTDKARMITVVALFNSIPNVFWSLVNLLPASIYCYRYITLKLLLVLVIVSFLPVLLPVSFLNKIMLSKSILVYRKIGVEFISRFTQNGSFVNRLIKKKYPGYKVISGNKESIGKLLQQTYMFEKFHLLLFVFFIGLFVYALKHAHYWWALFLTLNNIAYNVYPWLLQQYTRVRLSAFKRK